MQTAASAVIRRRLRAKTTFAVTVIVGLGLTLAGCSGSPDSSSSSASPTASGSASASASATSSGDVVALAEAFAATLSDDQRTALNQEYTFANATNWSNLPNALLGGGGGPGGGSSTSSGRVGLQTDSLSDEQWTALEALLAGVTGTAANEGFDEIEQHLAGDDYLGEQGGGSDYGRGNYFIAFLGIPSDSGTWELQFGGHHLAVANTYIDGTLAGATPSFRGMEPFTTVEFDGVTVQPEQQEQEAFAALLASLDSEQLGTAELSSSYNDILLGPGEDWAFPTTTEGIAGSALNDTRRRCC